MLAGELENCVRHSDLIVFVIDLAILSALLKRNVLCGLNFYGSMFYLKARKQIIVFLNINDSGILILLFLTDPH